MVLTDKEIREYSQREEEPLIAPFQEDQLQAASYDVKLSGRLASFKKKVQTVDLSDQNPLDLLDLYEISDIGEGGFVLQPGEYVLAELQETLTIPDEMIAHIRPRTRFTRSGLVVMDQHCNPTYSGALYIGLFNASPNGLKISKGLTIAQVIFERLTDVPSEDKLYKNKSNAAYMNESGFRGSVLKEQGWTKELEDAYNDLLASLNKRG